MYQGYDLDLSRSTTSTVTDHSSRTMLFRKGATAPLTQTGILSYFRDIKLKLSVKHIRVATSTLWVTWRHRSLTV